MTVGQKHYRALATRFGRWWAITVPDLPRVHTQGKNWAEAQEMAADAISAVLDCPRSEVSVELVPDLENAPEALEKLKAARLRRDEANEHQDEALKQAAQVLRDAGVPVRDAGAILGIPYQHVSRLTGTKKERRSMTQSKIYRIQPSEFIDNMWEGGHVGTKLPYPFYVDEKGLIGRQDFWNGNPYRVVGFVKDLAVKNIDLRWQAAIKDPSKVVGMYLVTSDKEDNWGIHQTAIASIEVLAPLTPETTDAQTDDTK